jgi:hypothetical protein
MAFDAAAMTELAFCANGLDESTVAKTAAMANVLRILCLPDELRVANVTRLWIAV